MEVLTCIAQKVWTDQLRLTPYTYRVVLHDFVYVKCFFLGIVDVQLLQFLHLKIKNETY